MTSEEERLHEMHLENEAAAARKKANEEKEQAESQKSLDKVVNEQRLDDETAMKSQESRRLESEESQRRQEENDAESLSDRDLRDSAKSRDSAGAGASEPVTADPTTAETTANPARAKVHEESWGRAFDRYQDPLGAAIESWPVFKNNLFFPLAVVLQPVASFIWGNLGVAIGAGMKAVGGLSHMVGVYNERWDATADYLIKEGREHDGFLYGVGKFVQGVGYKIASAAVRTYESLRGVEADPASGITDLHGNPVTLGQYLAMRGGICLGESVHAYDNSYANLNSLFGLKVWMPGAVRNAFDGVVGAAQKVTGFTLAVAGGAFFNTMRSISGVPSKEYCESWFKFPAGKEGESTGDYFKRMAKSVFQSLIDPDGKSMFAETKWMGKEWGDALLSGDRAQEERQGYKNNGRALWRTVLGLPTVGAVSGVAYVGAFALSVITSPLRAIRKLYGGDTDPAKAPRLNTFLNGLDKFRASAFSTTAAYVSSAISMVNPIPTNFQHGPKSRCGTTNAQRYLSDLSSMFLKDEKDPKTGEVVKTGWGLVVMVYNGVNSTKSTPDNTLDATPDTGAANDAPGGTFSAFGDEGARSQVSGEFSGASSQSSSSQPKVVPTAPSVEPGGAMKASSSAASSPQPAEVIAPSTAPNASPESAIAAEGSPPKYSITLDSNKNPGHGVISSFDSTAFRRPDPSIEMPKRIENAPPPDPQAMTKQASVAAASNPALLNGPSLESQPKPAPPSAKTTIRTGPSPGASH